MNLLKICDRTIEYSFYLLFLLVPLIMTPWNFELFEYNKMMLTYALTTVIVGAWIGKMILTKQFVFCRTPFDIPLFIFLIAQFLSFLFSIDRHTSFWGYYSRFHGGLLSTISYLLLYWTFVSNFDRKKTLAAIRWALYAALFVAFYGILEHFGIDAQYWVQDVKNRVFSTLGQPNWLAAYLAALLPLPLAMLLSKRQKGNFKLYSILYTLYFVLLLLCVFFTGSRSGYLGAGSSLGFFLFLLFLANITSFKKQVRQAFLILLVVLVVAGALWGGRLFLANRQDLAYVFGPSDQANITPQKPFGVGSTSTDIRKVVWRGSVEIFKNYPLFGSGVETFAYSYYQFRPSEHNLLSEWDFLYNKAHNEYLNFLATTGAVGLGSYLLLIGWIGFWFIRRQKTEDRKQTIENRKQKKGNQSSVLSHQHQSSVISFQSSSQSLLIPALFAGWLSILITNFFGFSVVPVALFFFLFPAFAVVLSREEAEPSKKSNPALQNTQYIAIALVLFLISYFLFHLLNYWRADVAYAKGIRFNKQGEYLTASTTLQSAIRLNPAEPIYKDELAWCAANLAFLSSLENDATTSTTLVNFAVDTSNQILSSSPHNLNFYRTRAKIFFRLASINQNYLAQALQTLLAAQKLAPTDAKILYNLGLVQEAVGQKQEAISTFERVVKIKPNYLDARYGLAVLYKEAGQTQKAIQQLEGIISLGGYKDADQKLKEWKVQ